MNIVVDLINDLFKNNCENYDEIRGCFLASNMYCPRSPFISLSECDEKYLARVQYESDNMVKNDQVTPSDSLQLEYITLKSQGSQVSKIADYTSNTRQ